MRMPVLYSPYSTVSASSAQVMVLSRAMPRPTKNSPRRAKKRLPLTKNTTLPTMAQAAAIMKPRFLPRLRVTVGPNGPT